MSNLIELNKAQQAILNKFDQAVYQRIALGVATGENVGAKQGKEAVSSIFTVKELSTVFDTADDWLLRIQNIVMSARRAGLKGVPSGD